VKSENTVIITTFIVLPQKVQETDGPLGAAVLAKSLSVAFNASPILITEEQPMGIMAFTLHALDVNVKLDENEFRTEVRNSALILSFPLEFENAVEKAGRNIKGEYHTIKGMNISSFHAKIEPLIAKACSQGILTVGIGDCGNEVGMGNIRGAVEKFVPYATVCQCTCKGGIAAESMVDILVAASISNWGAYGVEACIAVLTGKKEALHTPVEEEECLNIH
jgi:hypothetical protein